MGETPLKMAIRRLREPPPSPRVHVPDVDPVWEATILRCLARRPEERFASAGEVVSGAGRKGASSRQLPPMAGSGGRGLAWSALALMIVGMTLVSGYVVYGRYAASATAEITSIAVLPLRNSSSDPEQDYLSDGISEGAHQPPVATARAEGRRQQFLIPLQRSECGSAGWWHAR